MSCSPQHAPVLLLILLQLCIVPLRSSVSPVWRTPVSGPKQNVSSRTHRASHSYPYSAPYYSRPEDYKLPDYRAPKPKPDRVPYRMPITPRGFRPANYPRGSFPRGPPRNGGPHPQQTRNRFQHPNQYYQNRPNPTNNGRYPSGWVPWNGRFIPKQALPYLNGAAPIPPQGAYGPAIQYTTKSPMIPSVRPESFTGMLPMQPSLNPERHSTISQTTLSSEETNMESLFTARQNPYEEDTETTYSTTQLRSSQTEGTTDVSRPSTSEDTREEETTSTATTSTPAPETLATETTTVEKVSSTASVGTTAGRESETPPSSPLPPMNHTDYFPRPAQTQSYQPPAHVPEDFSDHIDVKLLRPNKTCKGPLCGIDKDKVSLYTPPKGPTLVISNAAKDDAARLGYIPANPPLRVDSDEITTTTSGNPEFNPYESTDSESTTSIPMEQMTQPSSRGPHVFIPPQNFPMPSPPAPSQSTEVTTKAFSPTAQTLTTPSSSKTAESTSVPQTETSPVASTVSSVASSSEYTTTVFTSTNTVSQSTTGSIPTSVTSTTIVTDGTTKNPDTSTDYVPTYKPLLSTESSKPITPSSTVAFQQETSSEYIPTYKPLYSTRSTEESTTTVRTTTSPTQTVTIATKLPTVYIKSRTEVPVPTLVVSSSPAITRTTTVPALETPPFIPTFKPLHPETTMLTSNFAKFESGYSPLPTTTTTEKTTSAFPTLSTKEHGGKTTQSTTSTTERSIATSTPYYIEERSTFQAYGSSSSSMPPFVPNRVRGKTRVICKPDGIEFLAMTLFPFTGEIFANERKRVPGCAHSLKNQTSPTVFFPFEECGVKNSGVHDQRTQYHMQVVVVVEQKDGTSTIQSFMAQCVHQKIHYNKQTLPRRIEEALEELKLVVTRLEQKAPLPEVDMRILVDNHHELGPEVSEVDIGMPLAIQWRLLPESDAYGFHVRNCVVLDTISNMEMTVIDENGCSTDLSIFNHPHYDTYHDTASAHMWAFKVPDHSNLQIKCDVTICSDIPSSTTNMSSCAAIPTPPFCPDLITSPPNSILYDAEGAFLKRRRMVDMTEETQTVRAALCTGEDCLSRPAEWRTCMDSSWVATSMGFSVATLLLAIIINTIVRRRKGTKLTY